MIDRIRYLWQLLILSLVLLLTGIAVIPGLDPDYSLNAYMVTLFVFTLINLTAYLFMSYGIQKSNREGVVVLLAGIGLKLLLYLIYILVFWAVTKNLGKHFTITFFALYLAFTFLLSAHLFKLLKNK